MVNASLDKDINWKSPSLIIYKYDFKEECFDCSLGPDEYLF